jgi:hypothetical protein
VGPSGKPRVIRMGVSITYKKVYFYLLTFRFFYLYARSKVKTVISSHYMYLWIDGRRFCLLFQDKTT